MLIEIGQNLAEILPIICFYIVVGLWIYMLLKG